MKISSFAIILGLSLLPLQSALAQTRAKPQASSIPTSPPPPSWAFLLETKTQWLLIIKENTSVQNASPTNNSAQLAFPAGNGDTVANGQLGNFLSHSSNAQSHDQTTSTEAGKEGGTDLGKPNTFEGNTNDIPLEGPTRPSSGGPFKPSSPSS